MLIFVLVKPATFSYQIILDYEVENEYRCFVISENSNRIKLDLNRTLKGLIIGERFPKIYDEVVKGFAKLKNIELYKNNFQPGVGYNLVKYV